MLDKKNQSLEQVLFAVSRHMKPKVVRQLTLRIALQGLALELLYLQLQIELVYLSLKIPSPNF
jgi:hypothetical protein